MKLKNWHPFWHVDMPSPKIGYPMPMLAHQVGMPLARWHFGIIVRTPPPFSLFLKGEGSTLPKISRKGGMEKLLQGKGDSVGKGGMLLVWVFFLVGV